VTAGALLSLIFPPILELMTFWSMWETRQRRPLVRLLWIAKNAGIVVLGVFGLVGGLYSSIEDIVNPKVA